MARIIVIGAHGKVALLATPLLVESGHRVTGVIRNPDHAAEVAATGAEPEVTDVETVDDAGMRALLDGHDVVVWSAGAGGGNPARTRAVDHQAAVASMDAAQTVGARRYVMVSYLGSRPDHGVPPDHSFFPYAEAKAAADAHLRSTALDWTILGPGALTLDDGTGRVEIAAAPQESSVPRADVAGMIAAVVDRDDTIGHTIPFNTGPDLISDALDRFVGG